MGYSFFGAPNAGSGSSGHSRNRRSAPGGRWPSRRRYSRRYPSFYPSYYPSYYPGYNYGYEIPRVFHVDEAEYDSRDTPYWHDLGLHDEHDDDPYSAAFFNWQKSFQAYGPPRVFKGFDKEKNNEKEDSHEYGYY